MAFTKLDRGLLQSSILAEDPETFKVWIIFLAACDEDGVARVSPVYVSSIAHLSMESVEASIKRLSAPDPSSRSTVAKGRRLRRVDGGFEVVNYHVYRSTSLRDAEAERKRLYRQKRKKSPSDSPTKKIKDKRGEIERRPDNVRTRPDNVRTPGSPPLDSPGKEHPDKDGLLPIPAAKDISFENRDPLVTAKAEIRADLRDLASGKKGWTTPERVQKRIDEFNQRVRDLVDKADVAAPPKAKDLSLPKLRAVMDRARAGEDPKALAAELEAHGFNVPEGLRRKPE